MEMTQEEYREQLAHMTNIAVAYSHDEFHYHLLKDEFNELAERCGANKGINEDATLGRRKLLAQSICIRSISRLHYSKIARVEATLNEIAKDYDPRLNEEKISHCHR